MNVGAAHSDTACMASAQGMQNTSQRRCTDETDAPHAPSSRQTPLFFSSRLPRSNAEHKRPCTCRHERAQWVRQLQMAPGPGHRKMLADAEAPLTPTPSILRDVATVVVVDALGPTLDRLQHAPDHGLRDGHGCLAQPCFEACGRLAPRRRLCCHPGLHLFPE